MIFLANVLVMNGGTTFLLRMSREYQKRGQRCAILLLSSRIDLALVNELEKHADLIYIKDYVRFLGPASRTLLSVFAPLDFKGLLKRLSGYGCHLHVMSIFGLVIASRLLEAEPDLRMTVGIYHQNEFLYRPPPFYFAREMRKVFRSIPASNVIFFNDSSMNNYAHDFDNIEYQQANILPIGISLDQPPLPRDGLAGCRIVSIGNLVEFKTYNRHIIGIVAKLKTKFPEIRYDIYGVGPTKASLAELAERLGVAERVHFHGALDYRRIRETVAGCDLFVGSGTALIEAAAVGRPAMIGIESIESPETYGFLSDARGFSYNENLPGVPKYPMADLVERLFEGPAFWSKVAKDCVEKASQFSVSATVDGFDLAGRRAPRSRIPMRPAKLARLAGSVAAMSISEHLGRSESFGQRRNQSY